MFNFIVLKGFRPILSVLGVTLHFVQEELVKNVRVGVRVRVNFITFQDVIVSREKSIQYFLIIFSNITSSHVHLLYNYSKYP